MYVLVPLRYLRDPGFPDLDRPAWVVLDCLAPGLLVSCSECPDSQLS